MTWCKLSSASLAFLSGMALVTLIGLALTSTTHGPSGVIQLFFSSLLISIALVWPMAIAPFCYGKMLRG